MSAAGLPLAAGAEPGVDAASFRAALGRFATGVALVTADAGGTPLGLVVSSLASVSLRPPLVSFHPSLDSFTWARMRRTGRFGVNVLAESHAGYVRAAARPGADRFAGLAWTRTPAGVPRLDGAIAYLECAIETEYAAGDHSIVVGRVERAETASGPPLLTWASDFARLTPGPDTENS
jgi:3-hydroxy-9,10-secoandrosta-1,3,5(10)-triene-9,17-dione monooxygenase reductase component